MWWYMVTSILYHNYKQQQNKTNGEKEIKTNLHMAVRAVMATATTLNNFNDNWLWHIYYDVIGVIVFVGLVWCDKHFNNK